MKTIKRKGTKLPDKVKIKLITFSLLKTDNVAQTFIYSVPNRVPFFV